MVGEVKLTKKQKSLLLFTETFKKYGYHIEDLSYGSTRQVMFVCEVCGKLKENKYKNFLAGLGLMHRKCSSVKRANTCLKKYGVRHISQSNVIKEQKRQTTLKHYGVDYISQSSVIQERKQQTNLRKRGVRWPTQAAEVKQKVRHAYKVHYGVEHPRQLQELVKRATDTRYRTWLKRHGVNCEPKENIQEAIIKYIAQCMWKEQYVLLSTQYTGYRGKLDILCPRGHKYDATWNDWQFSNARCSVCKESKGEKRLHKILSHIYPSEVIVPQNNLGFLKQQTVDFSIPRLRLAFEYDGLQHFQPVTFGGMSKVRAEEVYRYICKQDRKKNRLCKQNNFMLIRIKYTEQLVEKYIREKIQLAQGENHE